jgi:hypothetical protein
LTPVYGLNPRIQKELVISQLRYRRADYPFHGLAWVLKPILYRRLKIAKVTEGKCGLFDDGRYAKNATLLGIGKTFS